MEKADYKPAPAIDVLSFQQQRIITVLFREFLVILEDIGLEHDAALQKLTDALPPEYHPYVDLADYLPPDKGKHLRKKVLDRGNDTLRALDEILKNFNIQFK